MKIRFTEEQIVKPIGRMEKRDACKGTRCHTRTLYLWKKRFKDLTVAEAKRMRDLETENAKLKRLVAEEAPDLVMLKDVNSKTAVRSSAKREAAMHLMQTHAVSERSAARFLGLNRSTVRYESIRVMRRHLLIECRR